MRVPSRIALTLKVGHLQKIFPQFHNVAESLIPARAASSQERSRYVKLVANQSDLINDRLEDLKSRNVRSFAARFHLRRAPWLHNTFVGALFAFGQ